MPSTRSLVVTAMTLPRRRMLRMIGSPVAATLTTGCLSRNEPRTPENGDGPPDGDGSDGAAPIEDGDVDDLSIDGRLRNDGDEAVTVSITIRNTDGEVIAGDEWRVEAGETVRVPGFGRPGESRTFEVTVEDTHASRTLAFDVEPVPGRREGFVDITYTRDGEIDIDFVPTGSIDLENDFRRIVTPASAISEPPCGDTGQRDPLWLCEQMSGEPSTMLTQIETTATIFDDEGLDNDVPKDGVDGFYATVLTEGEDRERLTGDVGGAVRDLVDGTAFDEEAVLVVQTGWGSGSETPHLTRIEETDGGFRAYGCSRRPCGGTSDVTVRTTLARFERTASLDPGFVSLIVDAERMVNVAVGEGVVVVGEG